MTKTTTVDPIADEPAARREPSLLLDGGELVELADRRPAVSYDRARELLPVVALALSRIDELRGWLVYVIEQDCAANSRTEVRIGDAVFSYKGSSVYAVDSPAELHAELSERVGAGELSETELDAAILAVAVPAVVEWRTHNGRLNDLLKRGGAIADAIRRHRVETTSPAKLKPKGK